MLKYINCIFWLAVAFLLTLIFAATIQSFVIAFFFVVFLLPVVLATSLFFNHYLVPIYLLKGKWKYFSLYLVYMLIVSIYLELLVMVLAFVILGDYQIENLGKIAGDVKVLTIVLYLVVFLEGLVITLRKLKEQTHELRAMEYALERNSQEMITIREDRKNVPLLISELIAIESLSDYVKIHTESGVHLTKEKISALHEQLPTYFLRVHRSFVVNRKHICSFTKEEIELPNLSVPIGRKYAKEVKEILQKRS